MRCSGASSGRVVLVCLLLALTGCGGEDDAPAFVLRVDGWPAPEGGTSAIYRVTADVASDDLFRERDQKIPAKATIQIEQRETIAWAETGGIEIQVLRGLIRGTLEREKRGKLRKGSLGDMVGIGRSEETAIALRAWFTAPGSSQRLPFKTSTGATPGLAFSLVPRPKEEPSEGLRWDHDTIFLPSLEDATVLRATSTLVKMGPKTWTIESLITGGDRAPVKGKRTLTVSAHNGMVLEGTFEGTIVVRGRRGDATVRLEGRLERIEEAQVSGAAQQVETALVDLTDDDPKTRATAAKALGGLFPHGGRGAHVLAAAALDDEDRDVKRAASDALLRLAEQSVDPVLAFLQTFGALGRDDYLSSMSALLNLGALVTPADAAGAVRAAPKGGALAMALTDFHHHASGKRHLHGDVCEVLSNNARPLVQAGLHLRDPDAVGFTAMSMALHAAGKLPSSRLREASPELLALTKHDEAAVRWTAIRLIDLLGTRGGETMKAVREVAQDEKRTLAAARSLVRKSLPNQPDALEAYVRAQADKLPAGKEKVEREHLGIVEELGGIGTDAKPALKRIEEVMRMVRGTGRPSVRALIVAEALCRIDRPTGARIGLFTMTLKPPPKTEDDHVKRVLAARAQRAASALAHLTPDIRSKKMRQQIGQRVLEGLSAYQDANVLADLLHVIEALGTDARFAAKPLAAMLKRTERDWQQTLALDVGTRGDPDRADRSSLLLEYGNDVSRELVLRHGLVRVLRAMNSPKAVPVLEQLSNTRDPLLRYQVARTLRRLKAQ